MGDASGDRQRVLKRRALRTLKETPASSFRIRVDGAAGGCQFRGNTERHRGGLDIAHRAALQYAFASILLAVLAGGMMRLSMRLLILGEIGGSAVIGLGAMMGIWRG